MKIPFQVAPDGGEPFEVEAVPRDVLLWERTSKDRSITKILAGEVSMEDLYVLAHVAAKRQGKISVALTLDEFEKGFDVSAEVDEDGDGEGPGSDPSPTAR